MKKMKIVFKDEDKNKVAVGLASFEDDFVKIHCDDGNTLYVNKKHIVFMKEVRY